MNIVPLQTTAAAIGGGETATFYILGSIVVLAALGVVFSRRAVYSALMMAVVMIGLAVFYGINEAPFLMVVQIVVYTGAVLMLFLFVLMLVGVSSSDSLVETIRGHRLLTAVIALCFLVPLVSGLSSIVAGEPVGLSAGVAAAGGSIPWLASEIIYRYVIAFEATGALLITAVLGAWCWPTPSAPRRSAPRSRCRWTGSAAATPLRCPDRAPTPGTTPSTCPRCCLTGRSRNSRSTRCWPRATPRTSTGSLKT